MHLDLPRLDRWLLSAGLWTLRPSPSPTPVLLDGAPMAPRLHASVARHLATAADAIADRLRAADAHALLVDAAGLAGCARPVDGAATWALPTAADALPTALAVAARRGAFDLILVAVETGLIDAAEERDALAGALVEVARRVPPRPWWIVGIGECGWRDPFMTAMRRSACTVAASGP